MDEQPDHQPQDSVDLEVSDLRAVASGGRGRRGALGAARHIALGARAARPPFARLAGVAGTLALVVAALLFGVHAGAFSGGDQVGAVSTASAVATLDARFPERRGLACLRDAAWSPTGASFAFLGST